MDRFVTASGEEFERVNVRHPGAVAVVPVDVDQVLLVKQFRAPLRMMMVEIPAGKLDVDGESPEDAAARECEEETGYRPHRMELLRSIHTTVGFSNERIDIFLATELTHVGSQPDGVEERHASLLRMSFDEVQAAMNDGSITDAKTLIGLADALSRVESM